MNFRIGQGIDAHTFTSEKKDVVLGGVTIPYEKGLQGHSDADALTHAICDAILGALCLGDIGTHFSDKDPQHKNQSSLFFLQGVAQKMDEEGYRISNIDSTIVTEEPMLGPFISEMQTCLAKTLHVQKEQVSIKATRPEKMGALGRKEGLLAMANVLLIAS